MYGRPISFGIRRCEFDHYLLQRSGARVITGTPVTSIRSWNDSTPHVPWRTRVAAPDRGQERSIQPRRTFRSHAVAIADAQAEPGARRVPAFAPTHRLRPSVRARSPREIYHVVRARRRPPGRATLPA